MVSPNREKALGLQGFEPAIFSAFILCQPAKPKPVQRDGRPCVSQVGVCPWTRPILGLKIHVMLEFLHLILNLAPTSPN